MHLVQNGVRSVESSARRSNLSLSPSPSPSFCACVSIVDEQQIIRDRALQAESSLPAASRSLLRFTEARSHGSLLDASKDCTVQHGSLRRSAEEKKFIGSRDPSEATTPSRESLYVEHPDERRLVRILRVSLSAREKDEIHAWGDPKAIAGIRDSIELARRSRHRKRSDPRARVLKIQRVTKRGRERDP